MHTEDENLQLSKKMSSYLVICCDMIKIVYIVCERCHVAKETGNGSDVTRYFFLMLLVHVIDQRRSRCVPLKMTSHFY